MAKKKKKTQSKRPNWARLKTAFLSSKHGSLPEFAKEKGISISTLKKHAAKEGWIRERAELEPAAMQLARDKIIAEVAEDAVTRMRDWLTVADQLKANAVQALLNKGRDMDIGEAIKAIREASALEARVFGMDRNDKGKADGEGDGGGLQFNQVNIGKIEQNNQQVSVIREEIQSKLDRLATGSKTREVPGKPDTA